MQTEDSAPNPTSENEHENPNKELQQVIGPLIKEYRLLRESVDRRYSNLEAAIKTQKIEVSTEISKIEKFNHKAELSSKIEDTTTTTNTKINKILDENKQLRTENSKLPERIQKIESQQLSNNVIITGISEALWEGYDATKQRVHGMVAASMGDASDIDHQECGKQVEITCCSHVGRFRPNHSHPIFMTFQNKDDKEMLLSGKKGYQQEFT